jgi:hypothetical protein
MYRQAGRRDFSKAQEGRVAVSVGEGAQVVAILHAFLASANQKPATTA